MIGHIPENQHWEALISNRDSNAVWEWPFALCWGKKKKKNPVNHYQNDFLKSHLTRFINLKRLKTVLLKDILTGKGGYNKSC